MLELEGKFKDAEALGLNEKQYCGLIKTLALLESGALDHENEYHISRFYMGAWREQETCGTACCLGGTAETIMDMTSLYAGHHGSIRNERGALKWHPTPLFELFYPGSEMTTRNHPGWRANTKQAAVALRGYLETGRADWDAAMRT